MDHNENPEISERKQGVSDTFSGAAPTYDRIGPRFFSHFGRRLVELANIPKGAKVLDIATGRGAVLYPAADVVGQQGHVIGIDLSRGMIEMNREEIERLNLQNAEVREMDAENLEFPNESFGCVLCSFAIFFFPQLDRALSEMCRVLRPGGRIAVTTWGQRDETWEWLHNLIESYLPSDQEADQTTNPHPTKEPVFNTPEGLEAILASAGFSDIQIVSEAKKFTYADEEEWWSTLWSHGMREVLEEIEKKMGADGLKRFQSDAFEHLKAIKQSEGIHELLSVLFGLAVKPQSK